MAGKPGMTIKHFYVYEIYGADGTVIYVGKGTNRRAQSSMRERKGNAFKIVKWFERESEAFAYEAKHILKFSNLLNKAKGGNGGRSLKGDKEERLMLEIGTRAYAARILLRYYLAFKALASKLDMYYSKELQEVFLSMDPLKLWEVGYGRR